MKKHLHGLTEAKPAAVTSIVYFLLKRLGGHATFEKGELDALNGVDVRTLIDLSINEADGTITLEIPE